MTCPAATAPASASQSVSPHPWCHAAGPTTSEASVTLGQITTSAPADERLDDGPCTEVGVGRHHGARGLVQQPAGVEVGQRVPAAAQLAEPGEEVVALHVGHRHRQPEPVGQLADLVGQARRVEASGVGDHLDAPVDARAEDLLHLGEERVGPTPRRVALESLPQDEHGQLGQPVAGQYVDGAAVDHLGGGRQPVAVEAGAVGDAQRLAHADTSLVAVPVVGFPSGRRRLGVGLDHHQHPARLHLVPLGHRQPDHRPGRAGVDGVLHLHGLQHHQDLARLHLVPLGHGHPHHAARHGGQRRTGDGLVGGHRVPLLLDEARRTVGAVDVADRPTAPDGVAPGDAVDRQHHPVRGHAGRVGGEHGAVHRHLGERPAAAAQAVVHDHVAVTGAVGDRLVVDEVVAPSRGERGQDGGAGPSLRLGGQRGGHRMAPDGLGVGQRGGQHPEAVALEEARVGGAPTEGLVSQRAHQQVAVGGDAVDAGVGQRGRQAGHGLGPGGGVDDDLGQHGVVVGAHHAAGRHPGVDAHAGPVRGEGEGVEVAGRRQPPGGRVLGIEAGLDGVAHGPPGHGLVDLVRKGRAPGDEQLEADQVEAGDRLGDRVLHLETGVHLQEVGLPVARPVAPGVEHELDGAGVDVADRPGRGHRGIGQAGPQLGSDHRRRRLLDDLLVTPLDAALALEQGDRVAVGVGQHLDLDVAGRGDVPLEEHGPVAERRRGLAPGAGQRLGQCPGSLDDAHAPATTAGRGLDQKGPAQRVDLVGVGGCRRRRR